MISISNSLTLDSISRIASQQKTRLILTPQAGIQEELIGAGEIEESNLSDEEIIRLGQWALSLEDHFGSPQDIEWARDEEGKLILLQSRPLRLLSFKGQAGEPLPGYEVLLQGGETACPGVGQGIAVHLAEDDDFHSFPEGGVLIARRSSPRFVRVMNKARAIVTDFGSTTGHMASLARELRLPALLNTKLATQNIPAGTLVTVDATSGLVYLGEVPLEVLKPSTVENKDDAESARPYSPGLRMLTEVIPLVQPLNLTDPQSREFTAENCRTLHDMARYIHEKSYGEMFMLGERVGDLRASATQLDVFLPIDLYLIDLGGGLKNPNKRGKIRRSEVTSVPLTALLDGMLHEKIPRYGAKSMDMKGFLSIMMRHAVNAPEAEKSFQDPCYAIISDNYLNYTARVGYHFSVVDTYCSNSPNKNYISLTFRGGAADLVRRARRTRTIAAILQENGFHIELSYDVVNARLGKEDREGIISHLRMLGSLLQFFRQMDAAMVSEEMVDQYKEAFLRGEYDFGQRV
jgi:pyruvate,water dikinase